MDYLVQMPLAKFENATFMMADQATGHELFVNTTVGSIRKKQPLEIDTILSAGITAEFSLRGGRGWSPITFHGLSRHDGWILQQLSSSNSWNNVDQSFRGNDYWQMIFNQDTLSYSMSFVIPPYDDVQRYRLISKHCGVSEWSGFSGCSLSCGSGTSNRSRTITVTQQGTGNTCPVLTETRACNTQASMPSKNNHDHYHRNNHDDNHHHHNDHYENHNYY